MTGEAVGTTRAHLDVTRHTDVTRVVSDECPDVIANATACNEVDDAQLRRGNVFAVRSLAGAARERGAILVLESIDFVLESEPLRAVVGIEQYRLHAHDVDACSKLLRGWFVTDVTKYLVCGAESLFGGPVTPRSVGKIAHGPSAASGWVR